MPPQGHDFGALTTGAAAAGHAHTQYASLRPQEQFAAPERPSDKAQAGGLPAHTTSLPLSMSLGSTNSIVAPMPPPGTREAMLLAEIERLRNIAKQNAMLQRHLVYVNRRFTAAIALVGEKDELIEFLEQRCNTLETALHKVLRCRQPANAAASQAPSTARGQMPPPATRALGSSTHLANSPAETCISDQRLLQSAKATPAVSSANPTFEALRAGSVELGFLQQGSLPEAGKAAPAHTNPQTVERRTTGTPATSPFHGNPPAAIFADAAVPFSSEAGLQQATAMMHPPPLLNAAGPIPLQRGNAESLVMSAASDRTAIASGAVPVVGGFSTNDPLPCADSLLGQPLDSEFKPLDSGFNGFLKELIGNM